LYKYEKGQYFGAHYDDSVAGPPLVIEQSTQLVQAALTDGVPTEQAQADGSSTDPKSKHNAKVPKNKKKNTNPKASQNLLASGLRTTPTWSEWTILIYLSGHEDGIVGGETVFYAEEGKGKNKQQRMIVPPLKRGSALFHR
jgi:hypothetical protein